MKSIQLVLLACVLGGTTLFFTRMRSRIIDRVLVLVFAVAAATLAVFPEISGWMAIGLQVGRGVDVVIYFMLLFLWYVCLMLYSKLRGQESRLVELTRSIALANARPYSERNLAGSNSDLDSAAIEVENKHGGLNLAGSDEWPESARIHQLEAFRARRLNGGHTPRHQGEEPGAHRQDEALLRLDEFRTDRSLFQDDISRQGLAG